MRFMIIFGALVIVFSPKYSHASSNLAPTLTYQSNELVTQANLYGTNAQNLILVDVEINQIDQATTTLQAYLTPCANVVTQVTSLKTLLVADSNKLSSDPTILTDAAQFLQMISGLNSILNMIIPSSNVCLLQTQSINFARSNFSVILPHFDVEWSSIYPMSFTTNTQAGILATSITSLLATMSATSNNIQFNINNLTNCRAILVSVYNNYIDQMNGYFSLVAGLGISVPLTKRI